jgi:hypothetical protein
LNNNRNKVPINICSLQSLSGQSVEAIPPSTKTNPKSGLKPIKTSRRIPGKAKKEGKFPSQHVQADSNNSKANKIPASLSQISH